MNYPVQNDSRVMGLLRKYRLEQQHHAQLMNSAFINGGGPDQNRQVELERKLIDQKINAMKQSDEKDKLIIRMNEMKGRFNDMVREKAELQ